MRVERDGGVLRITLSRADRRNAFDAALISELAETFVDVGRARAVVLAGEGKSFSAGADVKSKGLPCFLSPSPLPSRSDAQKEQKKS